MGHSTVLFLLVQIVIEAAFNNISLSSAQMSRKLTFSCERLLPFKTSAVKQLQFKITSNRPGLKKVDVFWRGKAVL